MKTKVCTNCEAEKPIEEFQQNTRYRDGFSTWCKECHKAASTKSRKACAERDPDYHKNNALKHKHGWTPEKYSAKLEEQGGHCALCDAIDSKGQRLSVDHDHSICSSKYACDKCRRGLLCSACNARLGYLEQTMADLRNPETGEVDLRNALSKDSWAYRALHYLKSYQKKETQHVLSRTL